MTDVKNSSILVIGGGISGITAAIEAAEIGCKVYLVEETPFLGGRVARINKYYTKLCPPNCGLEMNFKRMKRDSNIELLTQSSVESISGSEGNYEAAIKVNPRYVNDNCTACGECAKACTVEIEDAFNLGMKKTKGAYITSDLAYPMKYAISEEIIGTDDAQKCKDACKYNAVDLDMKAETKNIKVGSVVVATGWHPYDASNMDTLGFDNCQNVISNVMLERLAAPNGPTEGKILRPSDGKEPKNIVFAQCAGSRDENHLPYCSGVCCLASLKQAMYLREQYPESEITMYYIDVRAIGRFEDFYLEVQKDEKISFVKGKVARVEEGENGDLIVEVEDTLSGDKLKANADLVVLATGMEPNKLENIDAVKYDEFGFVVSDSGIHGAGVAKRPAGVMASVQDSTGAALKAIQSGLRG